MADEPKTTPAEARNARYLEWRKAGFGNDEAWRRADMSDEEVYDETGTVSLSAWAALGAMLARPQPPSRLADLPPPVKPLNRKKAAQKAQRKARSISRGG